MDYWKAIEDLKWDGDYNRCMREIVKNFSQEEIVEFDAFVTEKVTDLAHRYNEDWLESINASDNGWSDLTYEVVGRGKDFYENITLEKLQEMADTYDYHESFAYAFHIEIDDDVEIGLYLNIQKQDLEDWRRKLNNETYKLLENFCEEKNKEIVVKEDVVRGDDLTIFIQNIK